MYKGAMLFLFSVGMFYLINSTANITGAVIGVAEIPVKWRTIIGLGTLVGAFWMVVAERHVFNVQPLLADELRTAEFTHHAPKLTHHKK